MFVSVLYSTSFVLHDGFPGSTRIRKGESVLSLLVSSSFLAGSAMDRWAPLNKQPVCVNTHRVLALIFNQLAIMPHDLK